MVEIAKGRPMKRSRAEMFAYLGAPLNNVQWSWGSIREADNAVFLVVWQDESPRLDGQQVSLVLNNTFWGDTTDSNGLNERRVHLERVRQGAKVYMIMARAETGRVPGTPRRIIDIDSEHVFVGGRLIEDKDGNVWLERTARLPMEKARKTS